MYFYQYFLLVHGFGDILSSVDRAYTSLYIVQEPASPQHKTDKSEQKQNEISRFRSELPPRDSTSFRKDSTYWLYWLHLAIKMDTQHHLPSAPDAPYRPINIHTQYIVCHQSYQTKKFIRSSEDKLHIDDALHRISESSKITIVVGKIVLFKSIQYRTILELIDEMKRPMVRKTKNLILTSFDRDSNRSSLLIYSST